VKRAFSRRQKLTIVNGILAIVGIIALMQLWLLSATMNAYLGGESAVITPAALASIGCLLLNLGLLWYLYGLERR
jgi:multidrug resistance efflux pump